MHFTLTVWFGHPKCTSVASTVGPGQLAFIIEFTLDERAAIAATVRPGQSPICFKNIVKVALKLPPVWPCQFPKTLWAPCLILTLVDEAVLAA